MKIIRHSWQANGFLNWICTKCEIQKHRLISSIRHASYSDKYGSFIGFNLPECKSVYHNQL